MLKLQFNKNNNILFKLQFNVNLNSNNVKLKKLIYNNIVSEFVNKKYFKKLFKNNIIIEMKLFQKAFPKIII